MSTAPSSRYPLQNAIILHKLSQLRNKETRPKDFRELVGELAYMLLAESGKTLQVEEYSMETPLCTTKGIRIKDRIAFIPILRSGLGMVDSALRLFPDAQVYHIGMYRDKKSLQPVEYYNKLPNRVAVDVVYVLDPMIATGGTLIATINVLKQWGAPKIEVIAILASEESMKKMSEAHPDVRVTCAAVDSELNVRGYLLPGLGDAGDRQFQTPH